MLLLFSGAQTPAGRTGTLAATLGAVTLAAVGAVTVSGALSQTLGPVTIDAQGVVGVPPVQGTLSVTLAALTDNAAGSVLVQGTLARTLGAVTTIASQTANPDIVVRLSKSQFVVRP
jgi:hypothetical protein